MQPFVYYARCHRVENANIMEMQLNLGFRIHSVQRFRLFNVDAPKIFGPGSDRAKGLEAKYFVLDWFDNQRGNVLVESVSESLGHTWEARIYSEDQKECLNNILITQGFAKRKHQTF